MTASEQKARELLGQITEAYRNVLKENLVGIYEHGSLAFGCFRWEVSDIDFLAVVKRPLAQREKEKLIGILLEWTDQAPEKGFEMSVVLEGDVKSIRYPTPFELHFSNVHLERAQKDLTEYCRTMNGTDRDLAAHCMVTRKRGRTVFGEPIETVFGKVPWPDYLDSIRYDIGNASEEILENPIYMTLNLCRVMAAVEEDKMLSKEQGGVWGKEHLPERWKNLVQNALEAYRKGTTFCPDEDEAKAFAQEMVSKITEEWEEAQHE